MKTKERILQTSVELFNKNGVQAVTTNHISKAMTISPGNLYFHFKNKEQIILELFKRMNKETYALWKPKRKATSVNLIEFIDENFELYWRYRFFHREMYSLRRKDPQLAKLWKAHIKKMMRMMEILYRNWVKSGIMAPMKSVEEMLFISEVLLAASTSFMQFFESADREPGRKSLERGKKYLIRLLKPYLTGETQDELVKFLNQ